DLERALDFGEEQLREGWGPRLHYIWDLYFLCLRSAFPDKRLPGGQLGQSRNVLFQTILASFPAETFLDDGTLQSVRLQRLLKAEPVREGPPPMPHEGTRRRQWLATRPGDTRGNEARGP